MQLCSKKKVALFLALILATVMIFPFAGVSAEKLPDFVALGDSTGFGLSAFPDSTDRNLSTLNGFNDMFAEYLGISGSSNYSNLAWPGDKTSDLLADLGSTAVKTKVIQADFLTVSIGGNNLLGPAIAAICGLWDVHPELYENDLDGSEMLGDLAEAIAFRYATIPGYNPMNDFMHLLNFQDPAAIAFHSALINGTINFYKEWPKIANQIRRLNNKAEFYVVTVHNPIQVSGSDDPLYPLYREFDTLIDSINLTIKSYALLYRYRVVDVNRAFETIPGALTFNIAGAIESATMMYYLTSANPAFEIYRLQFLEQTDPHPSYTGHSAAYELLIKVRNSTPAWFWR